MDTTVSLPPKPIHQIKQKQKIIQMRNKVRISIDDDMSNNLTKTQSWKPSQKETLTLERKGSSQMLSIHKNSRQFKDVDQGNGIEMGSGDGVGVEPVVMRKKKASQRYKWDGDRNGEAMSGKELERDRELLGFMSASENRVTFCKSPAASDHKIISKIFNKDPQKPISVSHSSKSRPRLPRPRHTPTPSSLSLHLQLQQKLQQEISLSQGLQKVVQDLQQHNKNIMTQTKERVSDFQAYIEHLLEANQNMEGTLLQYEGYIQMLENQRMEMLGVQRERELELERAVKESIGVKRELEAVRNVAKVEEKPKLSVQQQIQQYQMQQELQTLRQKLSSLEHDLTSKQQLIKMLEESITQKEQIIKKMTQFNNEICHEIIALKNNGIQSMGEPGMERKRSDWSEKDRNSEELKKNLAQLQSENACLREYNAGLCKRIQETVADNQVILPFIGEQIAAGQGYAERIQFLSNKVKELERNGSGSESRGFVTIKNRNGGEGQFMGQATFQQNFQFSQILPKQPNTRLQPHNFNPFSDQNPDLTKSLLHKIHQLLIQLLKKHKQSSTGFGQYKKIIDAMMDTLRQFGAAGKGEVSLECQRQRDRDRDGCILGNLDDGDEEFQGLVRKNAEVFQRIRKMKRKLREHIPGIAVSDNEEDNDRYGLKLVKNESSTGFKVSQTTLNLDSQTKKISQTEYSRSSYFS